MEPHDVAFRDRPGREGVERDAVLLHRVGESGDPLRRQDLLAGAANHHLRPLDELFLVGAEVVQPLGERNSVGCVEVEDAEADHDLLASECGDDGHPQDTRCRGERHTQPDRSPASESPPPPAYTLRIPGRPTEPP